MSTCFTLVKRVGCSFVLAGALVLTVPIVSEASSFGEDLLREGMEDSSVGELQEILAEKGYLSEDNVNGVFDPATTEAVIHFQQDHHLLVDGLAGSETIGALKILRQGDQGQVVTDLQSRLQSLGHYDGEVDGLFGPLTHQAVQDFQEKQRIRVDGLAGPETFGTLNRVCAEKRKTADMGQSSSNRKQVDEPEKTNRVSAQSVSEQVSAQEQQAENRNADTSAGTSGKKEGQKKDAQEFEVEATAYTADCEGCSGITFTGIDLKANPDQKVIAVDPNVIPLGSKVEVEGYGTAIAADVGGGIEGKEIDVFKKDHTEAIAWGRKKVTVRVLE